MLDMRLIVGLVVVGLVAALVLAALLAIGLSRPGDARGALLTGGLPLALLVPTTATSYASWHLIDLFSGVATSGTGMQTVFESLATLWWLQRAAFWAFCMLSVCGLVLAFFRPRPSATPALSSTRRAVVLVVLGLLALSSAGTVAYHLRRGIRVSAIAVSPPKDDPVSRKTTNAALAAEGLAGAGVSGISQSLGTSLVIGALGGLIAAVVLLGLAIPGLILAWRVRLSSAFLAAFAALWLSAALRAALLAMGLFNPLRLP